MELLVCQARGAPFLLLGLALLCGQVRSECERRIPNCVGENCVEKVECLNGRCGVDGACECLPCYSGPTCAAYDDKYGPRFAIRLDTVIVNSKHEGVVYKASAEDEDLGLTCPLGPGQHSRCPCAAITYSLRVPPDTLNHPLFTIHESSGQVFLREGSRLTPGSSHQLEIIASSTKNNLLYDYQTLTILVHREDHLDELLHDGSTVRLLDEDTEAWKADAFNTSQFLFFEDTLGGGNDNEELESLDRRKRYAVADENDFANLDININRNTILQDATAKLGIEIEYGVTILLPKITTAMQLVVEVFAMDPISGYTAFALCDLEVTSIGSKITTEGGAPLTPDLVTTTKIPGDDFDHLNNRANVDFGKILNTDTYSDGQTDFADSTIIMKFWVMLIPNPLYTNDSALVTVGAQYDNENYVYVGTDKLIYSMLEEVYTPKTTLLTPSATIAQYSGATFVLDSYLYHPFADVFFQVSIPSSTSYDAFSISSIGIAFMGSNFGCSGASRTTYYPSITNLTNYMGEYFIHLRTSGLTYPLNSADYHDNANFQIQFFFNVYAMHAAVGSTVDVDVGLVMGITSVFTDTVTLTVTAGVSPPVAFGAGSWSSASAITPTTVEEGQVVTWAATFTMDSGANVEVTCTLTDNGGNKVCGIGYGKVGANIAVLPALSQYLEFTADNSVTFTLFFNSTGEVASSSANAVEFEFSVIAGVSSTAISISCPTAGTPLAETLSATANAPSGSSSDVKVWMEFTTPLNDVWYEGSQMGLLLKLSFPAGGTPYTNLVVEGIGDVEKTAWGARTCGARLISAGKGVPCLTGHQFAINTGVELIDSLLGRPFVDTSRIVLGPACGTERTIDTADTDYEAAIELYFDMPQGQSGFLGGSYNLSLGVNLDNQVIWTGWDITQLEAGPPTADTSAILHYGFLSDSVPASAIESGVPQFIQVLLRLKPESVMLYKITAAVSNTDILNLCRIMVIQAGDNFPCLDKNPYDNKDELYPTISVTHDTDWGLSATLDLGVLKNLGNNTFLSGIIADENAIVVGVMVKGVLAGTDTLTVTLDSSGTTSVLTQELTVGSAITPNLALISVTPVPVDGTSNAYEGVMKMVDFLVEVPEGYKNTLKAIITNTAVTDMTVCFGAVVVVGQNLPCVIASKILGNMTEVTPTSEVYEVDMKEVCHYPFSENQTENQFTLRIGVMFIPSSGDTATLSLVIQEGGSDLAPVTFQLTKLSEAFSGEANETGMQLEPLIDVDTVTPGMQFWTGVNLTVPRDITFTAEFAVVTPTDAGRAIATVHDFRIPVESVGKNIGCILSDQSLYSRVLSQNASNTPPIIHQSQTDTMTVNLIAITNTGITHLHNLEQPEDDQVHLEAFIMIADHPNVLNGDTITVYFSFKTGSTIYVVPKNFILNKPLSQVTVLISEVLLTDNTTTVFKQGETIPLTIRTRHFMNESTQEVNAACARIIMPQYLKYVDGANNLIANITGTVTVLGHLDYCFDFLLFTDILEANLTITVDPDGQMPPGLGQVKATTLLRVVGNTATDATIKYFGKTAHVVYEVNVPDASDPLGLGGLMACQFTASASLDGSTLPEMAMPGSGGGWSPPVTVGASWKHYITIDFLKPARVTRIDFEEVTGKLSIKTFRLQYSQSGIIFSGDCQRDASSQVVLPAECIFEARFFRILVETVSDGLGLGGTVVGAESGILGVRFVEWYGAYKDGDSASCATNFQTRLSDKPEQWRNVAYDTANKVFYICDISVKREVKDPKMVCLSSPDGDTWNVLPSYVTRLVGFYESYGGMCAASKADSAVVCSRDGKKWNIMPNVDHADILANAVSPTAVPGLPESELQATNFETWSVDFTGVSKDGTLRARWANCCS